FSPMRIAAGPSATVAARRVRNISRLAAALCFGLLPMLAFAGESTAARKSDPSPVTSAGLRSVQEWREIIDATWGQGPTATNALRIFDLFWETMDEKFACFQGLDVDWKALRDRYRPEVASRVSRGRFAAIMNHLALALQEW